ncbi:MAG TPA: hypothetical protein VMF60_09495 [Acidimicrobiales bacterium]|nr:hypothetical protein [Acidimicrobiales bacterium]
MAKPYKTLVSTAVIAAGILTGAVTGAQAVSQPVGPNQSFVGMVNGKAQSASIEVLCPGPLRRGQRGNPAANQTVAVATPSSVAGAGGYTGSLADSIVATLASPSSSGAVQVVTFTSYGSEPIPTTWSLPCTGKSTMVFAPRPTSKTARSARVGVTFIPVCDAPVCPLVRGKTG